MEKSKIVKIFAITCGFCFSNMYASLSEALLNESVSIIYFGVAGLEDSWQTMRGSFVYFAEKWREKVKKNSLLEGNEQLKLKDGILASLIEIVKDLEEFAKGQNDDEEQRLRSIANRSDPRIRSLMLSKLEQIKKKKEDKVDHEDPSTVSAKRRADPRTVKGKNSRKSKKK